MQIHFGWKFFRLTYFIFLFWILSSVAASSQIYSVDIRRVDPDSPINGFIHIMSFDMRGSRMVAEFRVEAPRFFSEADQFARAEGNFGSSRNRLFWAGPTHFIGGSNDGSFWVRSRVRYESWTYLETPFKTIKNKNFRDTKTVEIQIFPVYHENFEWVGLEWEIKNIRNFPGKIEQWLRSFGVAFDGRTITYIEDPELARRIDFSLDSFRFDGMNQGDGLSFEAVLSFDIESARRAGVEALITRAPSEFGYSLLPKLFGGGG